MYNFLRNLDIKNDNVRHNLLSMDKESKDESKDFSNNYKNTGSFILLVCPSTKRILLGLRGPDSNYQPNTWNPLGGTMEKSECPILTAIREVYEEGQILPSDYKIEPDVMYLDIDENIDAIYHIYIYLRNYYLDLEKQR